MIRNYLTVALRNLLRHKVYSAINLLGLSVGMACCLLILLYVQFELSYDSFHEHADRIYRVELEKGADDDLVRRMTLPLPFARSFKNDHPEIEQAAIVHATGMPTLAVSDRKRLYQRVLRAEPAFFDVLSFQFLNGSADDPLEGKSSAVITASAARRLYGDASPIGEILRLNPLIGNPASHQITGVIEDPPPNSHLSFDIVVPFVENPWLESWGSRSFGLTVYLLLHPDASTGGLVERQSALFSSHVSGGERPVLQPLRGIHLASGAVDDPTLGNSIDRILVLSTLAGLILLLACINYVNLATALSLRRMGEVGVRKALGARSSQLVRQFSYEGAILAVVAGLFSLGFAALGHPWFAALVVSGAPFSISWTTGAGWLALSALVGLASGVYPAICTIRHRAASRGAHFADGVASGWGRLTVRRSLILMQFIVSAGLLCGTLVVGRQLDFLMTSDLGFDREAQLVVPILQRTRTDYQAIKAEVGRLPGVTGVAASKQVFLGSEMSCNVKGEAGGQESIVEITAVDLDYVEHYGLEVLAGRNLQSTHVAPALHWERDGRMIGMGEPPARENVECVVNEAFTRAMGFTAPQAALGVVFSAGMGFDGTVVGVTKDFHFRSLREPVTPAMLVYAPSLFEKITASVRVSELGSTIKGLEEMWNRFAPDYPFEYTFLDDRLRAQYAADERLRKIVSLSCSLAVLIACVGLFGLTAFATETRTREIGIRKALGASVGRILSLIGREFVLLVAIANVIAWPLAYYAVERWLESFAYRIEIEWWVFLLAGLVSVGIAVVTVNGQAIRAAMGNPVDALRYE